MVKQILSDEDHHNIGIACYEAIYAYSSEPKQDTIPSNHYIAEHILSSKFLEKNSDLQLKESVNKLRVLPYKEQVEYILHYILP